MLAPMSGVTDLPFRLAAARLGAGLVVSEMIASEALVRERRDMRRKAEGEGLNPFVIQLAGCEGRWIAEGARVAEGLGADIVDLNMGCPAKLVTGKQSGSALMRDLDHALTLIEAAVGAVSIPVTLKMRLGWDASTINAPDLALRAESVGIRLITVHGRTRSQFFKGRADWRAIRAVKEAVSIPVIANGDAASPSDVMAMIAASGADGAMIGRGCYGAPWLPGRIAKTIETGYDPGDPLADERRDILQFQYQDMLVHYGRDLGVRIARKHLGWVAARECAEGNAGSDWRRKLCAETDPERVQQLIGAIYDQVMDAAA